MIWLIFLFSSIDCYYLFQFGSPQNESVVNFDRILSHGPVQLSKKYNLPNILIYSDGYIGLENSCASINAISFNKSLRSDAYYSEISDQYTLSKYSNHVKKIQRYYLAKWGFQITWVNHLIKSVGEFNSFQIIVLSNGYESYVVINYNKINTFHDFRIGFTNKNCTFTSFFEIDSTGYLLKNSNVKKSGLWVFRIDEVFSNRAEINKYNFFIFIFYLIKYLCLNF